MSAVQQVIYEVSSVVGSAALIGTWRVGVKAYKSLRALHGRMDQQDVKLDHLEHETTPNTGRSIKDTVARIETAVTETNTEINSFGTKLQDHLVEAAAVRATVEAKLDMLTR